MAMRRLTPDDIMVPTHLLGRLDGSSDGSRGIDDGSPDGRRKSHESASSSDLEDSSSDRSSSSEDSGGLPTAVRQSLSALTAIGLGPAPAMSPECAICSKQMVRPAIGGGCAHHACEACYRELNERRPSCPVCRAPVWQISVDYEFARLVGCELTDLSSLSTAVQSSAASTDRIQSDAGLAVTDSDPTAGDNIFRVTVEAPAGITLSSKRGTVVVARLHTGNGAHRAGVRVRDQVLAINGTAISDHSTGCDLIERAGRLASGECVLTLRRRPPHLVPDWMRKIFSGPLR